MYIHVYNDSSLERSRKIKRSYSFARYNDVTSSSSEMIFAEREPEEAGLISLPLLPNYMHSFRRNKIEDSERRCRKASATPPLCHSATQSPIQSAADRNTTIFRGKETIAARCLGMSDICDVHRLRENTYSCFGVLHTFAISNCLLDSICRHIFVPKNLKDSKILFAITLR